MAKIKAFDDDTFLAEELEQRILFSWAPVDAPEVAEGPTVEQVHERVVDQTGNYLTSDSASEARSSMTLDEEIEHVRDNLSEIAFFSPTQGIEAGTFQIQALATLTDGSVYDIGRYLDQVVTINDEQAGIGDIRYIGENTWMNYGSKNSNGVIQFGYTAADGTSVVWNVNLDFDEVQTSDIVSLYEVDIEMLKEYENQFQATEVRLRSPWVPEDTITITKASTGAQSIEQWLKAYHESQGSQHTPVIRFEVKTPRDIKAGEAFQVRLIAVTVDSEDRRILRNFDVTDFVTFDTHGEHIVLDESKGIFYDDGGVFGNRYGAKSSINLHYDYTEARIKSYYYPRRVEITHEADLHYQQVAQMDSDARRFSSIDAKIDGTSLEEWKQVVYAGDRITITPTGNGSDVRYIDYADIYMLPVDGKFPDILQRHEDGSFTIGQAEQDTEVSFKVTYGQKEVIKTITVKAVDPWVGEIVSPEETAVSETLEFRAITEEENTRNVATGRMNYYLTRETNYYVNYLQVSTNGTDQMQLPTGWRGRLQSEDVAYSGSTIGIEVWGKDRYGRDRALSYGQYLNITVNPVNGELPEFIQKNADGTYTIGEVTENTTVQFKIDYGRHSYAKTIHVFANPPIENFIAYVNGHKLDDHHPLLDSEGNLRLMEGAKIHLQVFADYGNGTYKDVSSEFDFSGDRQDAPGKLTLEAKDTRGETTTQYNFSYLWDSIIAGSSSMDVNMKKLISFHVTSYDHDYDFGGDRDDHGIYGTGNGSVNNTILNPDGTIQSGGTIVDGKHVDRYSESSVTIWGSTAVLDLGTDQSGHHLSDYIEANEITQPTLFVETPGSIESGATIVPTVWYVFPGAEKVDVSDIVELRQTEQDGFIHFSLANDFNVAGHEVKFVSQAVLIENIFVPAGVVLASAESWVEAVDPFVLSYGEVDRLRHYNDGGRELFSNVSFGALVSNVSASGTYWQERFHNDPSGVSFTYVVEKHSDREQYIRISRNVGNIGVESFLAYSIGGDLENPSGELNIHFVGNVGVNSSEFQEVESTLISIYNSLHRKVTDGIIGGFTGQTSSEGRYLAALSFFDFMEEATDHKDSRTSILDEGWESILPDDKKSSWDGLDADVWKHEESGQVVVAFGGTDLSTLSDVYGDLFRNDIGYIALNGLAPQAIKGLEAVGDLVTNLKDEGLDVIAVGHSLGGYVAEYVAQTLDIPSMTIGAPWFSGYAWGEIASINPEMEASSVRIVHSDTDDSLINEDLVTRAGLWDSIQHDERNVVVENLPSNHDWALGRTIPGHFQPKYLASMVEFLLWKK